MFHFAPLIYATPLLISRHYLIPLSLQQKSKWRKKGTKLHIYGEHTFVAKHMSRPVTRIEIKMN